MYFKHLCTIMSIHLVGFLKTVLLRCYCVFCITFVSTIRFLGISLSNFHCSLQQQSYSMEGACALGPSHYNNLQSLHEKPSILNQCSPSKVPESLLHPAHDMRVTTTNTSTNHQAAAQMTPTLSPSPMGGAISKKAGGYIMPTAANKGKLNKHPALSFPSKNFNQVPAAADANKPMLSIPTAAKKKAQSLLLNGAHEGKINNNEGHR